MTHTRLALAYGLLALVAAAPAGASEADRAFTAAWENAQLNREALNRAHAVLQCWIGKRDPHSHLISEHWSRGYWCVSNAAADIYASLVVMSHFTDHGAREGFLTQTL